MMQTEDFVREACEKVYKELGPGYSEVIYQNALLVELREHYVCNSEVVTPVFYKDQYVGMVRADIVLDGSVIEIKAVSSLSNVNRAQVKKYISFTPKFLVNFSVKGDLEFEKYD